MQKAGHRDPSTTKLYDRRGYNPEKAASRFATYLACQFAPDLRSKKAACFQSCVFGASLMIFEREGCQRTAVARVAKSFLLASPNSVRKFIPPLWAISINSRSVRFGPK